MPDPTPPITGVAPDALPQVGSTPSGVRGEHIVLVGLSGVGKSVVGRRLADLAGLDFVDLDERITATTGRTPSEIFAADGEVEFRRVERIEWQRAAALERPTVISAGGGIVVLDENLADLIDHPRVVWLRATSSTIAPRVEGDRRRPLFHGVDAVAKLDEMIGARGERYAMAANIAIDVDDLTVDEAAAGIASMIEAKRASA